MRRMRARDDSGGSGDVRPMVDWPQGMKTPFRQRPPLGRRPQTHRGIRRPRGKRRPNEGGKPASWAGLARNGKNLPGRGGGKQGIPRGAVSIGYLMPHILENCLFGGEAGKSRSRRRVRRSPAGKGERPGFSRIAIGDNPDVRLTTVDGGYSVAYCNRSLNSEPTGSTGLERGREDNPSTNQYGLRTR